MARIDTDTFNINRQTPHKEDIPHLQSSSNDGGQKYLANVPTRRPKWLSRILREGQQITGREPCHLARGRQRILDLSSSTVFLSFCCVSPGSCTLQLKLY
ncbi:hypothetical protein CEXT_600011 [Caerostris extrusa]|uniref:Uncharacterized protein n=1 Tax=Caerostris extrusa TaxID=172846 RepID=A0AAV4RDE9_CAEEX|nr:hypothetical protein CEXT_600011 [Caerostris extrusa]